jgi:hypothetical protein
MASASLAASPSPSPYCQNIDPRLRFKELKRVDCCPALRGFTGRPRKQCSVAPGRLPAGRVGEDVTTLPPHIHRRHITHPVPRARVSLTMSWTTVSAVLHTGTRCSGRPLASPVSSAIHAGSWTQVTGFRVPPVFLDMVLSSRRLPSLLRVPASLVPRSRRYYEGATTSHLRISGRLFCSLPPPT